MMAPANALVNTTEFHVQVKLQPSIDIQISMCISVIIISLILSQHFVMMMLHAMVMENVTIMEFASAMIHFMEIVA